MESDEKRDRTMLDSAALEFLDADGHAITDSSITVLEGEQVEVTIPVLKLKEVPLKFEFSNVPAGYDPAELNASISPATIRIAGAADTVDGIESVNAGFINLARVQLGKAETLKIQLSEGLVNVDDVQEATVTFDTSGYGEPRAITVSDIRVVNAPLRCGCEGHHRKHQQCNAGGRGRGAGGHLAIGRHRTGGRLGAEYYGKGKRTAAIQRADHRYGAQRRCSPRGRTPCCATSR